MDSVVNGWMGGWVVWLPASIQFRGLASPSVTTPRGRYHKTHATLVRGRLRPAYFGVRGGKGGKGHDDSVPGMIFTSNTAVPFNSIGEVMALPDGTSLYKVFSQEAVDDRALASWFLIPEEDDDAGEEPHNATFPRRFPWYAEVVHFLGALDGWDGGAARPRPSSRVLEHGQFRNGSPCLSFDYFHRGMLID